MERIEYSALQKFFSRVFGRLVGIVACKFGDHSYQWKLKRGETIGISGPPPDRAKCHYCKKTFAEINREERK